LEFGRNIGIIPGPIHDLLSQGGYELIRQGASLVTNKNDIYELLSLNNDMKKNENINIEQKIINFCLQERLIEEIINEFNINKNDAMKILFDLLRKKLIMQDVMGKWKKR
jgi:predicted Rossmann fold nucleotide-binding protein DprA/Smf involved in DNA uptake